MRISNISVNNINKNLSFKKFKDKETDARVRSAVLGKPGKEDHFFFHHYEVLRDCPYIEMSTDKNTGKVIAGLTFEKLNYKKKKMEILKDEFRILSQTGAMRDVATSQNCISLAETIEQADERVEFESLTPEQQKLKRYSQKLARKQRDEEINEQWEASQRARQELRESFNIW